MKTDFRIDIKDYAGRVFGLSNATTIIADDVRAVCGTTTGNVIVEGFDTAANVARITNFKADKNVTISKDITDFFFRSKDETIPNMTIYQNVTADNQIPNIANNANDIIYLRLRSTPGSWTMGALPDGYKRGQLLIIRNSGSGANTITIRTGSTYNSIPFMMLQIRC
ncbi:hypothetical protein [Bacillus sp. SA1-12]|uniref:hypothetical protein n=1 Tax=Bacillus sp. SA1-12 TaxID=1455638 RepID=UPI000ABDC6FC|nr:hypothetical protein [Bacillus sp. SA1-12]